MEVVAVCFLAQKIHSLTALPSGDCKQNNSLLIIMHFYFFNLYSKTLHCIVFIERKAIIVVTHTQKNTKIIVRNNVFYIKLNHCKQVIKEIFQAPLLLS